MARNYIDDKDMKRKDENEIKDYQKGRTGYIDGEDPSMEDKEQQFPGDEIVEDLRELSRQQGQQDGNPTFLNGENVQQEPDKPRYGDSISETADKEFRKKEVEYPLEGQNERNDQNSGQSRKSN